MSTLSLLSSASASDRSEGLEHLRDTLRTERALPVLGSDLDSLFRALLPPLLSDPQWNVSHQALQLLEEAAPALGPTAVDSLCVPLLRAVVSGALGDAKVVLRRQASAAVAAVVAHSGDATRALECLVPAVTESPSARRRAEAVGVVQRVSGEALRKAELAGVVDALIVALSDPSDDVTSAAIGSLEYVRAQVPGFERVLDELSEDQRTLFDEIMGSPPGSPVEGAGYDDGYGYSAGAGDGDGKYDDEYEEEDEEEGDEEEEEEDEDYDDDDDDDDENDDDDDDDERGEAGRDGELAYGFVDADLLRRLRDRNVDWKIRAAAIEELYDSTAALTDPRPLVPHLRATVRFLTSLVDDSNFKISLTALQILGEVVTLVGPALRHVTLAVLAALIEKLGDNKIVIRQANIKVVSRMLESLGPGPVLPGLLPALEHRNWHVREEVMNLITVALLMHGTFRFDYGAIISGAANALADVKPRVRFVATQCLAAVNHNVGREAVEDILDSQCSYLEPHQRQAIADRAEGTPAPVLTRDGVLKHSGAAAQAFADDPLATSGSSSLASSRSSLSPSTDMDGHEHGQQQYQQQQQQQQQPGADGFFDEPPVSARRIASAGRAKSRGKAFPWEKGGAANGSSGSGPPLSGRSVSAHAATSLSRGGGGPGAPSEAANQWGDGDSAPNPGHTPTSGRRARNQPNTAASNPHRPSHSGGVNANANANVGEDMPSVSRPISGRRAGKASSAGAGLGGGRTGTAYEPSFGGGSNSDEIADPFVSRGGGLRRDDEPVAPRADGAAGNSKIGLWLGTESARGGPNGTAPSSADTHPDQHRHQQHERATAHGGIMPSSASSVASGSPRSVRSSRSYDSKEVAGHLSLLKQRRNSTRHGIRGGGAPSSADDSHDSGPQPESVPQGAAQRQLSGRNAVNTPTGNPSSVHSPSTKRSVQPDRGAGGGGGGDDRPIQPKRTVDFANFDPNSFAGAYPDGVSPPPTPPPDSHGEAGPGEYASSQQKRTGSASKLRATPGEKRVSQATLNRRKSQHAAAMAAAGTPSGAAGPGTGRRTGRAATLAVNTSVSSTNSSGSLGATSSAGQPRTPSHRGTVSGPPRSNDKTGAIDDIATEDLVPSENPTRELSELLSTIRSDDWERVMHAMFSVRRLAVHHGQVLHDRETLADITKGLMTAVDNLRSSVSKNAAISFRDLFTYLGRAMDAEVGRAIPHLIRKVVGSVFIAEEVDAACEAAMQSCNPSRFLAAITVAAQHKNPLVRGHSATLIERALGHFGARATQQCSREMDKIFPVVGSLVQEASAEIRNSAKVICKHLDAMYGSQLQRKVSSLVSGSGGQKILEIVEKRDWLSTLSAGPLGSRAASGRRVRSGTSLSSTPSRGNTGSPAGARGGSASGSSSGPGSRASSRSGVSSASSRRGTATASSRRGTTTSSEGPLPAAFESLPKTLSALGSSDWRARHSGLETLYTLLSENPEASARRIVPIFDAFNRCIVDSNAKVNAFALQTLIDVVPRLNHVIDPVIKNLVPALATNMASVNAGIREQASQAADALIAHADNAQIVRSFADIAQQGNARVRPEVLGKLTAMVPVVHSSRPALVSRYILPVALHTLSEMKVDIRNANGRLLKAIYACVGESLLSEAQTLPQDQQTRLKEFIS